MKLSDYVAKFVVEQNVKHFFMLPGGGCLHLVDSLGHYPGLKYVCNHHEQASSIAAEAYSQFTENLGVCLVTTGPGGTNAVTGVAGAYIDSTPVLFLSGQVKRADLKKSKALRQMGPQEVDIISVVESLTKYAVTVLDPSDIRFHLEKALYLAKSGRPGPVWLDIPLDVQGAIIDEKSLKGFTPMNAQPESSSRAIDFARETIQLLEKAERPVILAGNGIRLSKAKDKFEKLVRNLGIPVLTTWKAMDLFDENDPLYCGRPGSIGQRGANFTQQNCDLIITLGARLDHGQLAFNHQYFARAAKKVIVDVDPEEIKKLETEIHVKAVCDVGEFIDELNKQSVSLQAKPVWSKWLKRSRDLYLKYPVVLKEYLDPALPKVNLYALVESLSELLGQDDVIVPGSSGACSEVLLQAFKVKKGQRIVNTPGLGAMGFGLPAVIGVSVANSGKRTICINGEGGLQLNIQELDTLKRLNLPIKILCLNNNGYGSIIASQKNHFDGRLTGSNPESGLSMPDMVKIAEAYGIKSWRINNQKELQSEIKKMLTTDGPVLVDVMIDENHMTLPRVKSKMLPGGKIISLPMEDLYPFLDREEFKENMLIDIIDER